MWHSPSQPSAPCCSVERGGHHIGTSSSGSAHMLQQCLSRLKKTLHAAGFGDVYSRLRLGDSVCVCVFFFTLILCPSAARGLLQVFQQEGLEDLRAAMESSQDVQHPPASLAAITAQHKSANIHSGLQAREKRRVQCVLVCGVYVVNVLKQTYGLELVLAVSCLRSWQ